MSGALRQAQSVNREKKAGKLAQFAAQSDMQGELARISSEEEAYLNMSPIDRLKLNMPSNAAPVGDEQQAANTYQNTHDALSVLPWAGSAVAMKDAWDDSGHGAQALGEGRYKDALGNYTGMLANTLGAVLPFHLPNTPAARQAAQDAPTQANMFAGPMAKTADHAALAKAQEMADAGVGRDAIHAQTGWHQGVDGQWKFEIDDSAAAFSGKEGRLGAVLDHPELHAAYPDIAKGLKVEGMWGPGYGGHDPGNLAQRLWGKVTGSRPGKLSMGDLEDTETGLHEVQHAIQGKERFASGGNPVDAGGMENYRRLAGEVEARNVGTRLNMTAAERRAKAPWETQDVPDDQQIVRMKGGGVAESFPAWHASPHDFDEFKLNKETIATGEGNQAYGRGLYMAESEAVSGKDGAYYKQFLDSHGKAHAYKVEIDAEPHQLLDWHKPLGEQSEEVRGSLSKLFSRLEGRPVEANDKFLGDYGKSGESIYGLAKAYGDEANLTKALHEAGIPGIKFLDRGSRGGEAATSNYVIFDDRLAKIKSKDGQPVPDEQQIVRPGRAVGAQMMANDPPRIGLKVASEMPVDKGYVDGMERVFHITNGDNVVGQIHGGLISPDTFKIDWMQGVGDAKNTLGPAQIKQTISALREQYPGLRQIVGERGMGARQGTEKAYETVSVKLPDDQQIVRLNR